jgi:hypothetical protein
MNRILPRFLCLIDRSTRPTLEAALGSSVAPQAADGFKDGAAAGQVSC